MSATVNSSQFQEYFDCPLLDIPGRLFPVQIMVGIFKEIYV